MKSLDCIYRIFGRLAAIGSDKYLHMFAGLVVSMIACKALHAIDAYLIFALVPAFFVMTGKRECRLLLQKGAVRLARRMCRYAWCYRGCFSFPIVKEVYIWM